MPKENPSLWISGQNKGKNLSGLKFTNLLKSVVHAEGKFLTFLAFWIAGKWLKREANS